MKTYNFKKVAAICGGFQASGFAEGSGITVAMDADAWMLKVGADGEGTRSKSNNNAGKVKFKLAASSPFNAILQTFYNADQISDSGLFPFLMKDGSGKSLYFAEQMWVEKQPDAELGMESGEREWTLASDSLICTEGGN